MTWRMKMYYFADAQASPRPQTRHATVLPTKLLLQHTNAYAPRRRSDISLMVMPLRLLVERWEMRQPLPLSLLQAGLEDACGTVRFDVALGPRRAFPICRLFLVS